MKDKNVKKISLINIKSNPDFLLDLNNTDIKNFNLLGTEFRISGFKNSKNNNLLVNYNFLKNNRNLIKDGEIEKYNFDKKFFDFFIKNKDNANFLFELYYKYKNDIYEKNEISEENFEIIWFENKFRNSGDNKIDNFYFSQENIDKILNKNVDTFNLYLTFGKNISKKEIFRTKINKLFGNKNFRDYLEKYVKYLNFLTKLLDSFSAEELTSKIDFFDKTADLKDKLLILNSVYKYKNNYIFVRK